MQSGKIGLLQLWMLGITGIGFLNHVLILPALLRVAHRDAWLSVMASGVLFLLWIPALYLVIRLLRQQHVTEWVRLRFGTPASLFVAGLCALPLLAMTIITTRETVYWARTFLPETPPLVLAGTFLAVCLAAALSGLSTVAIMNGILLPLIVLFGFFVMLANMPSKEYAWLLPVLSHGWRPVCDGCLYAGAGFAEIAVVLFLQSHVKQRIPFWSLFVTALILIFLTIGPTTGAIAEFGANEPAHMRYPAYEEWRLVAFSHFAEHTDFLSIYQWLAGAFIRVSLALFLLGDVFRIRRRRWIVPGCGAFLALAATLAGIRDELFAQWVEHVYLPVSLLFFVLFSGLLPLLALRRVREGI